MYDSIIIGCGFAGAVAARELAEKNKKVLVIEQRSHIGGNCYDCYDGYGILIHKYGPHIFHTNIKRVYDYLSKFTKWYDYSHEVVGSIHGKMLPIPFNLNTLFLVYGEEKGMRLKEELVSTYGMESRVPILTLRQNSNKDIQAIADFVYENIFLRYTMKQWGKTPEEINPNVTARVPVLISYDNRYFQDNYQGMPLEGYTVLFKNLLHHENITVKLNTKAKDVLTIKKTNNKVTEIFYNGVLFTGDIIYSGAIDELFDCEYGALPYRSLDFVWENYKQDYYQAKGVVNYTVSEKYTRITEFKYLTGQKMENNTTIVKEYSKSYHANTSDIPYYAIENEESMLLYNQYKNMIADLPNFYLLGRLAEFKYYNIDAIVDKALSLAEKIVNG